MTLCMTIKSKFQWHLLDRSPGRGFPWTCWESGGSRSAHLACQSPYQTQLLPLLPAGWGLHDQTASSHVSNAFQLMRDSSKPGLAQWLKLLNTKKAFLEPISLELIPILTVYQLSYSVVFLNFLIMLKKNIKLIQWTRQFRVSKEINVGCLFKTKVWRNRIVYTV